MSIWGKFLVVLFILYPSHCFNCYRQRSTFLARSQNKKRGRLRLRSQCLKLVGSSSVKVEPSPTPKIPTSSYRIIGLFQFYPQVFLNFYQCQKYMGVILTLVKIYKYPRYSKIRGGKFETLFSSGPIMEINNLIFLKIIYLHYLIIKK